MSDWFSWICLGAFLLSYLRLLSRVRKLEENLDIVSKVLYDSLGLLGYTMDKNNQITHKAICSNPGREQLN